MQRSKQLAAVAVALAVVLSTGTAVAFTSSGNWEASGSVTATDGDHDNETNETTTTVVEDDEENETPTPEDEPTVFGASFQVTSVEVESVEAGEPLTITATVTNPNDVTTGQFVEVRLSGVLVQFGELTLDPGESMTLRFSVPTEGLADGLYVVSVLAREDGRVTVVAVGAPAPPENVTENVTPTDNVTDNVTNVTEPEDNVTEPEDNVTNITEPEDNVTNVTEPEDNVTLGNESFEVTAFDAPESAEAGELVTVTATVTNPNDVEVTQDVEFRVLGNVVERRAVTLGAGESENVTFTLETEGVPAGEYVHAVLTRDFGSVAILELTEPAPVDNETVDDETADNETINVTDDETVDNETVDNVTADNETDAALDA